MREAAEKKAISDITIPPYPFLSNGHGPWSEMEMNKGGSSMEAARDVENVCPSFTYSS